MTGLDYFDYELYIFDSDGVLLQGNSILPGARELTSKLKSKGIRIVIFSNNSTMHPRDMEERYNRYGIEFDTFINSGILTASYLEKHDIHSIFVVGENGLKNYLKERGFHHDRRNADAVIVGMDRSITHDKLTIATRLVLNGAKFIGTNPDKTFPTENGIEPGAGAMIATIIATTDRNPDIVLGKPSRFGFDLILSNIGIDASNALMIGDRYETDIIGAHEVGIDAVIVNTGIAATRNDPGIWKEHPRVPVLFSLADLITEIQM